ncbi:MAG: sensor histidine kinase [Pseudomonadota bacterium]
MNADPASHASVKGSRLTNRAAVILAAAIATATFVVDILTPAGVALSTFPYFIVVALSTWMNARAAAVYWLAICSALVLAGIYIKGADISLIMLLNRATIILLLCVTAFLASLRQRSEARLQQSHETLEQEVARRTEELARRNAQLRTSLHELEKARARAEISNVAKTRFLSQMSHELRTPLNAILGFSDTMRQEVFGPIGNPAYRQYSSDIYDSGNHLFQILEAVLEEARLERAEYVLHEEDVDIPALIKEVVQGEADRAKARQVDMQLQIPPGCPRLNADPAAMRRMLANLLSNAVKFSPDKSVVRVIAEIGKEGLRIEFHDQGNGIPPEDRELVLLPFETGHAADTAGKGGAGLGLSITLGLATLHDAKLELKAGDGCGTIAILQFPPERIVEAQLAE